MSKSSFREIGLLGASIGTLTLKDDRVEWRDVSGKNVKEYLKGDLAAMSWTMFGQKGYLKMTMKEGQTVKLDGFQRDDFEALRELCGKFYSVDIEKEKVGVFSCQVVWFGLVWFGKNPFT